MTNKFRKTVDYEDMRISFLRIDLLNFLTESIESLHQDMMVSKNA